jgi:hypothetical protein
MLVGNFGNVAIVICNFYCKKSSIKILLIVRDHCEMLVRMVSALLSKHLS